MLQNKTDEELARHYALKAYTDIEYQDIAYDAYLAGLRCKERLMMSNFENNLNKIINFSLEDLSANCRNTDHVEYIIYRLKGGELTEEEWFLNHPIY